MSNQTFMVRPCDGSCNTVEDPFGRIFVPNKMDNVNLKVFSMIKGINKSKTLVKYISCKYRCEFEVGKCNLKKLKNGKCHCKSKKPIKHGVCKEDYPRSPSLCACDCGKDCEISKFLKD